MFTLLLACTQADFETLALTAREPLGDSLVEETEVLTMGQAWLTDDEIQGVWAEDALWFNGDYPVVDWSEDRVQVVAVENSRYRVMLWLDRNDLGTRTYDTTLGFSGEGEVELPSARAVDVLYEEDGATRIALTTRDLEIEAWVESDDLDQVWIPGQVWEEPDEDYALEQVFLPDAAVLLEEPHGDAFAWYRSIFDDDTVYAHAADAVDFQDGHALVRVTQGDVAVTGWVEDWDEDANGGFGGGCCCGGLSTHGYGSMGWSHTNVPADTPLQAWDGTVVGVTLMSQNMLLGERDMWGRTPAEVSTPWGPFEIWMDL
jgi:hypothetical protein